MPEYAVLNKDTIKSEILTASTPLFPVGKAGTFSHLSLFSLKISQIKLV